MLEAFLVREAACDGDVVAEELKRAGGQNEGGVIVRDVAIVAHMPLPCERRR